MKKRTIFLLTTILLALIANVQAINYTPSDWNSSIADLNNSSGDGNQTIAIYRDNDIVMLCHHDSVSNCTTVNDGFVDKTNIVNVFARHIPNTNQLVVGLVHGTEGIRTALTTTPLSGASPVNTVAQVTTGGRIYTGGGITLVNSGGQWYGGISYADADAGPGTFYWEAIHTLWGTGSSGSEDSSVWQPDPPPAPPSPPSPPPRIVANATPVLAWSFPGAGMPTDLTYYSAGWNTVNTGVYNDSAICATYNDGKDYTLVVGSNSGNTATLAQSFVDFSSADSETVVSSDRVVGSCAFNEDKFGSGYIAVQRTSDDKTEIYPFTISDDGYLTIGSATVLSATNCAGDFTEVYYDIEQDEFVMNSTDTTGGCKPTRVYKSDTSVNITWTALNIPDVSISGTDNDCSSCAGGTWSGSCNDPLGNATVDLKNAALETAYVRLEVPCLENVDLTGITLLGSDADQKIGISASTPDGVVLPTHTIVVPDTGGTPYFVYGSTPTLNDISINAPNAKVGTGAHSYTFEGVTINATTTDEGTTFGIDGLLGSGAGEGGSLPEMPIEAIVIAMVVILSVTFVTMQRKKFSRK